ncbi:MAG: aminodeoxychorismate/anthranilate synthase component II [Chloroflexi bacterium]|nr:aminodeoxychorismate/anthranilate synthase component II [Chloroflexota bacterium]
MIAVIDNYDSFTYNLVQLLGELGAELTVFRNDAVTTEELARMRPSHIVISPGPGDPTDAGVSLEVITRFYREVPILGVCLGHQCIAHAFGGTVVRAPRLMHGKTSGIIHDGQGILRGVPSPFTATRYHSLIVDGPIPPELVVSARTAEGEIMGLRHACYLLEGVQFHPESILTDVGRQVLGNFLQIRTCSPSRSLVSRL